MPNNITKLTLAITREINGETVTIRLTPSEVSALSTQMQRGYFYNQTVYYAENYCGLTDLPEDIMWNIADELLELSYRDEDEVLHDRIYSALERCDLLNED